MQITFMQHVCDTYIVHIYRDIIDIFIYQL